MSELLRLLLLLELLGLGGLALVALALPRLPGPVLGLAKPVGFLAAVWPVWLLAELGVVPFGRGVVWVAVALVAVGGGLVLWRGRLPLLTPFPWRAVLRAEAAFLVGGTATLVLVGYSPDVWGTERPMDLSMLAGIDRSTAFPPVDVWMSGETLNYYYFGHVGIVVLSKAIGVAPSAGYNLGMVATGAMAAVAFHALGATIAAAAGWRRVGIAGAATAVGVLGVGSLHAGREALHGGGLGFDWFGVSRLVPGTINEFPLFSFLVGDLHAHVLALAPTAVGLAIAFDLFLHGPSRRAAALLAVVLGTLYAGNSWSYPIVAGLALLSLAAWALPPERRARRREAALVGGGIVLGSVVAIFPYLPGYQPSGGGVALVDDQQPLVEFVGDQVLILGAFGWVVAGFLLARARPSRRVVVAVAVGALVFLSLAAPAGLAGALLATAGAVWALRLAVDRRWSPATRYLALLSAGALTCVALPEVVYVRDVLEGGEFERANTVYRLGYHAWILLAVVAGVLVARGGVGLGRWSGRAWAGGAAILLVVAAAYLPYGTYAARGGFQRDPTLRGTGWLAAVGPGDVAALDWLRENVEGTPTVLEAVGDDYNPDGYGRISTYSGLPTVLGWGGPVHEGQQGHDPGTRREDVREIYSGADEARAQGLLRRYGVRYVVAGPLELRAYGTVDAARLDRLGRRAFSRAGTTIWIIGS